jgi:ribosomal protein S18 acetylase RimI-like enzyme
MRLAASTELSRAELARIFTAAYEGYSVPFDVDEATLSFMVQTYDLDLSRSLVAFDGDEAVGLANLGLRGNRSWLGGIGVVPSHRRRGVGERLCRALMDGAREAGATRMLLEVIVGNAGAIALYEKLGFETTRELEVLSLAAAEGGGATNDVAPDEAPREEGPPWQREDETIAKLADVRAVAAEGAAAIYRVGGDRVSLLQAVGDVAPLLPSLRSLGPVSALNYPARGEAAAALRAAGAEVPLRQLEMVARL